MNVEFSKKMGPFVTELLNVKSGCLIKARVLTVDISQTKR